MSPCFFEIPLNKFVDYVWLLSLGVGNIMCAEDVDGRKKRWGNGLEFWGIDEGNKEDGDYTCVKLLLTCCH